MATLSEQEKQDLLAEVASEARRADFAFLDNCSRVLSPLEYLEFLTWASSLSRESASDRKLPVEKVMLL